MLIFSSPHIVYILNQFFNLVSVSLENDVMEASKRCETFLSYFYYRIPSTVKYIEDITCPRVPWIRILTSSVQFDIFDIELNTRR